MQGIFRWLKVRWEQNKDILDLGKSNNNNSKKSITEGQKGQKLF
jgi:hypothetical protein